MSTSNAPSSCPAARSRSCVLSSVVLPRACATFANRMSLYYHAWNASPAQHLEDISALLDRLPALRMLCLTDHLLADYTEETDTVSLPLVNASRNRALRTARIFDVRAGSLPYARLRVFFVRCGVRHFRCQHSGMLADFPTADAIVTEYPRPRAFAVRLLYVQLRAADRDGHTTTLHIRRAFWDAAFLLAEPCAFAHLARLTINEHFWLQDAALLRAPALAELCVVMASCADYRMCSRIFTDGTCSVLHAEHAWACPALHAVQLAYDPPRDPPRDLPRDARCAPHNCCCADALAISIREPFRRDVAALRRPTAMLSGLCPSLTLYTGCSSWSFACHTAAALLRPGACPVCCDEVCSTGRFLIR